MRLQGRMDVTRQELAADDPQAAATLDDAMTMVRRAGVSGDMRDAAHQMETNRLSQASEQQDEVIQWLNELQDILANRRQDTSREPASRAAGTTVPGRHRIARPPTTLGD